MSLKLRWVGEADRDRVAETRMLCYAPARKELANYVERLRTDPLSKPGDWLLAERDGVAVGTATSLAMTMWVRGAPVPCQGVAYVGTIRTQRRRTGNGKPGVATAVMNETLRAARERGFVVSALMPFRGSFYEHFGYGFVERRAEWKVPISILPREADFQDLRFYNGAEDLPELVRFKQRLTERTHGDIERNAGVWQKDIEHAEGGHVVVERSGQGPIRAMMFFVHEHAHHLDSVNVVEALYEDAAGLRRLLSFLASLRDQYSHATLTLPADLPLNLLLREAQITHRGSRNHPTAEVRPFNRMQLRVLDHVKLLSAMKLPVDRSGKVVVAIRETEGDVTKLAIEVADGKAVAAPSQASADVEMPDHLWATIVMGDLPATRAAELGLFSVTNRTPLAVLDAFAVGTAPFCREYF